jgi:hypothetical protein
MSNGWTQHVATMPLNEPVIKGFEVCQTAEFATAAVEGKVGTGKEGKWTWTSGPCMLRTLMMSDDKARARCL